MTVRKYFFTFFSSILIALFFIPAHVAAAPDIAMYYLGQLPSDSKSWEYFGKSSVLIFSPDQIASHASQITDLKKKNPKLIVLAYVPSQSYNTLYWRNDPIFRAMQVNDSWWLRDASGKIRNPWPGLQLTNMTSGWSEYLVQFVQTHIQPIKNVDGIFFDMVMDGILGTDMNTVDLNGDGSPDGAAAAVNTWVQRSNYLLTYARSHLSVQYIVINGTSNLSLQAPINGRMFETFPTPWEYGGAWNVIMTNIVRAQALNTKPSLYIFNSNSHNTGKQNDYRTVRFGVASSLMVDNTSFGYDYGDTSHAQTWWYDEYDAHLGTPVAPAESVNGKAQFQTDVWRRSFDGGIALVNPTPNAVTVRLGGDYEKLIGTQDRTVNDGTIVDSVEIASRDGILLYKTFQTVRNTVFPNGSFLRFYRQNGQRARNGFFAFSDGYDGGVKLYHGDLDNDGAEDTIEVDKNHLRIISGTGTIWYDSYPYGDTYTSDINVAVGHPFGNPQAQIMLGPSQGGKLLLFQYDGQLLLDTVYPFGKNYTKGFSVAFGNLDGSKREQPLVATWPGQAGQVLIYDSHFTKVKTSFYPYGSAWRGGIKITAGDFNGDGKDEIATLQGTGSTLTVKFFNASGRLINQFALKGFLGTPRFTLGAADVNHEGKDELVVMGGN